MPREYTILNTQERLQLVRRLVAAGKRSEDIARAVLETWLADAIDEVEYAVRQHKLAMIRNEWANSRVYYPYLAPLPPNAKPRILGSNPTAELRQAPQRQPVAVRLVDLEAFCRTHHLDVDAMRRVGEGTLKEHRGWQRCPYSFKVPGRLAGHDFKEVDPARVAQQVKDKREDGQKRIVYQDPVQPTPTIFTAG